MLSVAAHGGPARQQEQRGMKTPTITETTAEVLVPFIKTLAAAGTLPKVEANAAAAVLREAAKPGAAANLPPRTYGQLLMVKEVARRLDCSSRTVSRMLDDGTLTRRYLREGRAKSLRIAASEVEALTCKGEVASA